MNHPCVMLKFVSTCFLTSLKDFLRLRILVEVENYPIFFQLLNLIIL